MNKWIGMGRATKDPETRYNGQMAISTLDIAVNRRFKKEGQPEADFFRCVAFGKTGEFVEKYIRKGTKVVIDGEIQNDNYEKDGVKHYGTKIIINSIEFAESKKENTQPLPPKSDDDDFMSIPELPEGTSMPF